MAKPVRDRATSAKVTPQLLRDKFVTPLSTLATMYATEAAELEKAIKEGRTDRDYLPIVIKGMEDKMKELRLFCLNVIASKRRLAEDGLLRYRDEYLEEKRKRYRDSK